ncbi:MAG: sensor histidine kinase [Nannocystaceae bacterium]
MARSLALPPAHSETVSRERGPSGGERGSGPGERDEQPQLDDRLVRRVGIAGFGLIIPYVTSLFAGVEVGDWAWWVGTVWFVALSAGIWHGNRWLLFEQRRHFGWFDHPVRKVVMLATAVVLYTVPLTVVALLVWFGGRGLPADWAAVQQVTLINVVCVLFVSHGYETALLVGERQGDRLRVAQLDRARAQAELAAFLAQIDPHFVFNSLHTLGHLIETSPSRAAAFNARLARVYRYLIRQRGRTLVPLREELAFVEDYVQLMRIRHGAGVACVVPDGLGLAGVQVLPTGIQLLVDNAIKHNEIDEARPLEIAIELGPEAVVVSNVSRPRRSLRPSAGVGLQNLDERSRLVHGKGIEVSQRDGRFTVRVPLTSQEVGE